VYWPERVLPRYCPPGTQVTVVTGTDTITPTSVSNADTTGVMRSSGSDGSYIYNMSVNLPKLNQPYTIIVYLYGGSSGPSLRHVIQATK